MNFSQENQIIPLLMCGGSGTRLWPMSRKSLPKQFLKYDPDSKNTFLQNTFLRVKKIKNIANPILICNEEHRFVVAEQMRQIEVKPQLIILEPFGRNTAPAIALGSLKAISISDDPILLVLSSDHLIRSKEKFVESIEAGINYAKKGKIVTFGILPDTPETGYGYIEAKEPLDYEKLIGLPIEKFIEKPNLKNAKKLILNKRYSWNSGIFLMKASVAIKEFEKFAPDIKSKCEESLSESYIDLDFLRLSKEKFRACSNISFDVAIMENTRLGIVCPLKTKWSDVGSWDAMWSISKKDENGNSIIGKVITEKALNCYVRGENKLVVGIDIEDLIVVDTYDALLITKKGSTQKVKDLVEKMKNKNYKEAVEHRKIYRPWGSYLSIADGENWQVKIINVHPGASLSLQKHNFRTEHWVVVSGKALVEVNEEKKNLSVNESTYIPLGSKHRLSNPGNDDLILIEVQSGTYLGEDDIIRFEDNYGR